MATSIGLALAIAMAGGVGHVLRAQAPAGAGMPPTAKAGPAAPGARHSSTLRRLAGAVTVAGGPGDQHSPALAAGADGYLAAWETCLDCPAAGADIAVRPLGASGEPSGEVRMLAATAADERGPSVAWNPDTAEYLVAWSLRYPGTGRRYAVAARRVTAAGEPAADAVIVAEVDDVWPAAVVSSVGAWHGYEVAWAMPGPRPDRMTTIIAARHLTADAVPQTELWPVSDVDFEALRPLASRASRAAGTLLAWFAYSTSGSADHASMRGIRLGASGRPNGQARELRPPPVCGAALTDRPEAPDLLLATVRCDGALDISRLNRSGDVLGLPATVVSTTSSAEVAVAPWGTASFAVIYKPLSADGLSVPALWAMALDEQGRPLDEPVELGPGDAPATAGGADGAVLVLAGLVGEDTDGSDVIGYPMGAGSLPSATPEPTAAPASPTATGTPTAAATSPTPTGPPRSPTLTATSIGRTSPPTEAPTASATGPAATSPPTPLATGGDGPWHLRLPILFRDRPGGDAG